MVRSIKILSLLFLAILLFQSYGLGTLQTNFHDNRILFHQTFTEGLMAFFRPMSVYSTWGAFNILYPIFALGWIYMIFMFFRKVKIQSWQFVFFIIVMVVFSYFGYINCMSRYREVITPIMLLAIFQNENIF